MPVSGTQKGERVSLAIAVSQDYRTPVKFSIVPGNMQTRPHGGTSNTRTCLGSPPVLRAHLPPSGVTAGSQISHDILPPFHHDSQAVTPPQLAQANFSSFSRKGAIFIAVVMYFLTV